MQNSNPYLLYVQNNGLAMFVTWLQAVVGAGCSGVYI